MMHTRRRFFQHRPGNIPISLIPLCLACVTAMAQAGGDVRPETYFEDMPVVLTASRLRQSARETPSAVTVIDRQTIAASGARQLPDLLRLVPGFYLGIYSGTNTAVAYHGLSADSGKLIQVLVDGVSIFSPLFGGVRWMELPIAIQDIERIEVVRGSSSVVYGANAFFAVVNIITRDPATEPRFQADIDSGGNGIQDVVLRGAYQGEDLRYRLTFGQRSDHGVESMPDDSRVNFFNLRGGYRLDSTNEIALRVEAGRINQQTGVFVSGIDPARTESVAQNAMQLRWTRAQGADEEFWLQFAHHDRSVQDIRKLSAPWLGGTLIPFTVDTSIEERRNDIEFQSTGKPADNVRLAWGGQWHEDAARSRANFNTDAWQTSRMTRLFGNAEWRPGESWAIDAGLMFERNTLTGSSTSPRLAAIWHASPGHTLRAGISRAIRSPTLFEDRTDQTIAAPAPIPAIKPLSILTRSSGNLDNARVLSREIGYVAEVPEWQFSGDIRWFNDQIRQMIMSVPDRPVIAWTNTRAYDFHNTVAPVRERGVEMSAHWRPWRGAQWRAATTYVRVDSDDRGDVESLPTHVHSLFYTQALPQQFSLSAGLYSVGSMVWRSWWIASQKTPAYRTLDLRLARQFRWGEHNAEIAVTTRNAYTDRLLSSQQRVSYVQLKFEY